MGIGKINKGIWAIFTKVLCDVEEALKEYLGILGYKFW